MKYKLFISFSIVGTAGFFVDAGVLLMMIKIGLGKYIGRAVSFACAVTATWYLNRRYTFKSRNPEKIKELLKFVIYNGAGGIINYSSYSILIFKFEMFSKSPISAVAIGSLMGLSWNFIFSKKSVFCV